MAILTESRRMRNPSSNNIWSVIALVEDICCLEIAIDTGCSGYAQEIYVIELYQIRLYFKLDYYCVSSIVEF